LGYRHYYLAPVARIVVIRQTWNLFWLTLELAPKLADGKINATIVSMRHFPNLAKLQQNACLMCQNVLLYPESVDPVRYLTDDIRVVVNATAAQFPVECMDCSDQVMAQLS
jgi:hypothetical protein